MSPPMKPTPEMIEALTDAANMLERLYPGYIDGSGPYNEGIAERDKLIARIRALSDGDMPVPLYAAPSAPDDEPECEFGVPDPKFRVGQLVEKASGYKWPGVVVSRFLTQSLQIRYVVECTVPEVAGALHIYSESQLVALGGARHE